VSNGVTALRNSDLSCVTVILTSANHRSGSGRLRRPATILMLVRILALGPTSQMTNMQRFGTFRIRVRIRGRSMHKIGLILYPAVSPMNFGVTSVFETANWKVGSAAYDVLLVSEKGGPVATSLGYKIQTSSFRGHTFDTVIVAGSITPPEATPGLLRYLRSTVHRSSRIASICSGALMLAEAGLLDARRATTHWQFASKMQRDYPKIAVDADRIFTRDGPIWTSAGMSAGIDLALALVEDDLGVEVARAVARILVVYHRRAGGQSQYSALLELGATSDRVQAALAYAKEHLGDSLSIEDLANVTFLSPRQFSRLFREETGQSPAKAIERLRVESAKLMMEAGRFSADEIARKNGFGNRERMRRAFVRSLGQPPQEMQRTARPHFK
jgi:transcriptional regulator GlxA family with amidase domain